MKDIAALKILIDKLRTIDEDSRIIFSNNPNMKVFIKEDYENDSASASKVASAFVTEAPSQDKL